MTQKLKAYGLPVFLLEEMCSEVRQPDETENYLGACQISPQIKKAELRELMDALSQKSASGETLAQIPLKRGLPGMRLRLSTHELDVLTKLLAHPGCTVERTVLCELLWHTTTHSTRSQLSALISRINQKFNKCYPEVELIQTTWGQGYFIEERFCRLVPTYLKSRETAT
ncbi:helix-turn-helix domain-containing protein [Enterococcus faecalis]|uniref:helix-turn-helix domain-containing protein n=1 Tax=Enterococcus faecalis TaxID=1351 RepID=UPI00298475AA|nr:helix-turn-helix domain-containing protein [Enterococcus faecalis]EKB7628473.1 helix-turn-helix domain-containing protein [Enterococcus faecalis]